MYSKCGIAGDSVLQTVGYILRAGLLDQRAERRTVPVGTNDQLPDRLPPMLSSLAYPMKDLDMRRPQHLFFALCYLTVAIGAVLTPKPALAGYICWIETVTKTPSGVEIHFNTGNLLTLIRRINGPAEVVIVWPSSIAPQPKESQAYLLVESVSGMVGETIEYGRPPHERCKLSIAEKNGQIGVYAHTLSTLPGLPHTTAENFIPAR